MSFLRFSPPPFLSLYGKSALTLALQELDSMDVLGVPELVSWVTASALELAEEDLREPTLPLPLFEPYVLGLFPLALAVPDLKRFCPSYEPVELEENAALLIALSHFRVEASKKPSLLSGSQEGEEVAKRRGWSTLQDPINDLAAFESDLVTLGLPIVEDDVELLSLWQAPKEDGSYTAQAFSVRTKLDLVRTYAARFAETAVDAALVARGKKLLTDGGLFFRGREGRFLPKTELTLARDQAFTLLLSRVERMQRYLRAAYLKNPKALEKLDGVFWKRLSTISKPRKPRKAPVIAREPVPAGSGD